MNAVPRRLFYPLRAAPPRRLHLGRILFLAAYTAAWMLMVYGAQLLLRRLF